MSQVIRIFLVAMSNDTEAPKALLCHWLKDASMQTRVLNNDASQLSIDE